MRLYLNPSNFNLLAGLINDEMDRLEDSQPEDWETIKKLQNLKDSLYMDKNLPE